MDYISLSLNNIPEIVIPIRISLTELFLTMKVLSRRIFSALN